MGSKKVLGIVATVVVLGGALGVLLFSSVAESMSLYKHVDEVMANPADMVDRSLQVHGFVEAGSIETRIEGQRQRLSFALEHKNKTISVVHYGPSPDTFKDGAEVVAKGKLVREGGGYVLHAEEISAKCPSKYEENKRNRNMAGAP